MKAEAVSAVILAAGRGSRLGNDGAETPKCLTEIAGVRLIDSQLAALRAVGIHEVIVVGGYRADQLQGGNYDVIENREWASTSMVDSMRIGLQGQGAACGAVVVYGDVYLNTRSLSELTGTSSDICVGYTRDWQDNWSNRYDDPLQDLESFRMDPGGRLVEIGGRVSSIDEIEGQFAGVLYLSCEGKARVANHLEADTLTSTTGLLAKMIAEGEVVDTFVVLEPWFEIDTEQDLRFARSRSEMH